MRLLVPVLLLILLSTSAHALLPRQGSCNLPAYYYDRFTGERAPHPLSCLDAGMRDSTLFVLVSNSGDKPVTLLDASILEYSAYQNTMGRYQSNYQTVCELYIDKLKTGEASPLRNTRLAAGESAILINKDCIINQNTRYQQVSINVTYLDYSLRPDSVMGHINLGQFGTAPAPFSALVYVPLLIFIAGTVLIIISLLGARKKSIVLGVQK